MRSGNRELWLALVTIFLITLLYTGVVYRSGSVPAARSFFGHSIGVVGFLMMISTEVLYSLRKRSRRARWGKMANWLQFHIFTGLVGPYLVLLHTSWTFNGLAGVVMLLTVVTVGSGVIGRYIYTAVPRSADGAVLEAAEIGDSIRRIEEEIALWRTAQDTIPAALNKKLASLPAAEASTPSQVFGRVFSDMSYRISAWREERIQSAPIRARTRQVNHLLQQRRVLNRQLASLAAARRMLSIWHTVHIPIGVALFTASFAHIFAAIYYAGLLH